MARAKSTGRAEARKRYRQAASQVDVEDASGDLDYGERKPDAGPAAAKAKPRDRHRLDRPAGFTGAMRAAYHPANLREDIRTLPSTLASRAFLAAAAMVIGGAIAVVLFPNYSGTAFAYELLVLPGAALAPQLVAGIFRATGELPARPHHRAAPGPRLRAAAHAARRSPRVASRSQATRPPRSSAARS